MKKSNAVVTKKLDFVFKQVAKNANETDCLIEGYANTSTKDRVGDVVLPSAFAKSLDTYMSNPILLENHNWEKIAGRVLEAKITDKGLYIKARVSDARPDLKTMVREGCLSTFSIGYNELDADYDESTKTKIVKALELLEISIVSVPANTEAKFQLVQEEKQEAPVAQVSVEAAKQEETKCVKCASPMEKTDTGYKCKACGEEVIFPEDMGSKTDESAKNFINAVAEAVGDELDKETVAALCDYYINEGTNMKLTTKQLVDALRVTIKSVAIDPSAPVETAKAEPQAQPAEQQQPAEQADKMDMLMQKLDAIAQGLAKVMELMQVDAQEDQAEMEPAQEQQEAMQEEGKALEILSDSELEAVAAEIDEQIQALDDLV